MPLMECVRCGHVQSSHPKFAYCEQCDSTQFRRASEAIGGG